MITLPWYQMACGAMSVSSSSDGKIQVRVCRNGPRDRMALRPPDRNRGLYAGIRSRISSIAMPRKDIRDGLAIYMPFLRWSRGKSAIPGTIPCARGRQAGASPAVGPATDARSLLLFVCIVLIQCYILYLCSPAVDVHGANTNTCDGEETGPVRLFRICRTG